MLTLQESAVKDIHIPRNQNFIRDIRLV